jgi:hypothetical protein
MSDKVIFVFVGDGAAVQHSAAQDDSHRPICAWGLLRDVNASPCQMPLVCVARTPLQMLCVAVFAAGNRAVPSSPYFLPACLLLLLLLLLLLQIMGRLAANRVIPAHNPLATTPQVRTACPPCLPIGSDCTTLWGLGLHSVQLLCVCFPCIGKGCGPVCRTWSHCVAPWCVVLCDTGCCALWYDVFKISYRVLV